MARISNRQIVEELKNGDRRGCFHLFTLYHQRLLNQAVGVFHVPKPDAEEIVSDVLLAAVRRIDTFAFKKSDLDFQFWLIGVFRNRVRDYFRHQALTRGLVYSLDDIEPDGNPLFSTAEKRVLESLLRRYQDSLRTANDDDDREGNGERDLSPRLDAIAQVLDQMETWERVLLRCRALDVSYEEIAEYARKPVKQLKVYHRRVKKKFMKLLLQQYPELLRDEEGRG